MLSCAFAMQKPLSHVTAACSSNELKRYEDGLVRLMCDLQRRDRLNMLSDLRVLSELNIAKIILRKEVIQPQVPLGLPCYDFTPVAEPTVVRCPLERLAHGLRVDPTPMV